MHLTERVYSARRIENESFERVDLTDRIFVDCSIRHTAFTRCAMRRISFVNCRLEQCDFRGCDLSFAQFDQASSLLSAVFDEVEGTAGILRDARFIGTRLADVNFGPLVAERADFHRAKLESVTFSSTKLKWARFIASRMVGVNFLNANLQEAVFVRNQLTNCNLEEILVTGIAAWKNEFDSLSFGQQYCVIDDRRSLRIRDIETAQLIAQVREGKFANAVNEMTRCAVLLLGRFEGERSRSLDAIKIELEARGYLPLIFDFTEPKGRTMTETVVLLAHMVKFIVADISEPRSVGHELRSIIPTLGVPVVPVIFAGEKAFSMFGDYWRYDWVLDIVEYRDTEDLANKLGDRIIDPALQKAVQIDARRQARARATAINNQESSNP
jgi:uncharacterized protein YjbI with pentapeptide repeats